jgi:uncharacterized protein YkwD/uncharacterized membrane protein required for colicin V production
MTDLAGLAGTLPAWAGGLNAVDLVLVLALAFYALDGIRRGFIAASLSLVGIFLTIAAAIKWYPLGAAIIGRYVNWPPLVVNVAGFFALLLVAQLAMSIVTRLILVVLAPVRLLLGPLLILERLLGAVPGFIQGMLIAALVLTPLHLFPISSPIAEAIDRSAVARQITARSAALAPQIERFVGRVVEDNMLFRSRVVEEDESVRLPPQADLHPDPAAEAAMLMLVNQERAKAGLQPVVADEQLRKVARQHSEEMFRLGYFAHVSPKGDTPMERLRRGGVFYFSAGENLAYAPTVEVAHSGLMASPGHRKNILSTEYSRVGIGILSAGLYGRMFTQNFAG